MSICRMPSLHSKRAGPTANGEFIAMCHCSYPTLARSDRPVPTSCRRWRRFDGKHARRIWKSRPIPGRAAGESTNRLQGGRYRARDFVLREGTRRMSMTATAMPGLSTLLRLGRISNVPTVWTNVLAGSVIAGGAQSPNEIALIVLAMTAFYVGGMYLNDYFDRAIDARDRPGRPIDAGEIRAGSVLSIGFGL